MFLIVVVDEKRTIKRIRRGRDSYSFTEILLLL